VENLQTDLNRLGEWDFENETTIMNRMLDFHPFEISETVSLEECVYFIQPVGKKRFPTAVKHI
jgi:hypothetical protein